MSAREFPGMAGIGVALLQPDQKRRAFALAGAAAGAVTLGGLFAGCSSTSPAQQAGANGQPGKPRAGIAQTGNGSPDQPPAAPREFRAAWVSTVANIDWPSRPNLPADKQQLEAIAILDRAKALHLNAIVLQ